METAPLKSFAMWARRALIVEVNARVAAVLAPGSKDRIESAGSVASLERDIAAAGGGDIGRDAIVDKVSYTWFNRIIALRFMDANGYTGIGVVSPARGQTIGQIEVLAYAKRGNIDPEVVTNKRTIETIAALLDGTRRSDDPQGEAYALLLAEYCRHWNRSMPFMFEREGDYTELLIPANLLADDSVLARAFAVLTEDVCQDVEVIGWLYQFYISERKDEVFAGFRAKGSGNKKAGAAEIPAATQLFTPHWIVRYLVENSVGRLWLLNRPSSRLAEKMEYYIKPVDEETDFLRVSSPEELKIIDPAVGSGHMLTYAFDLLYAIYEEDGYAPADIPGLILEHNLYGTEIDPRAGALAAFALVMKARWRQRTFFTKNIQPNICVVEPIHFDRSELDLLAGSREAATAAHRDLDGSDIESFWNAFESADSLGSLIQPCEELTVTLRGWLEEGLAMASDLFTTEVNVKASCVIEQAEYLSRRYAVVVANPPYMGSKNMGFSLSELAKTEFINSKSDLYAMFIERNSQLAVAGGLVGMVTMQSWMFLSTFAELRRRVLNEMSVATMAHLGSGAFDSIGGEVVATTAFILRMTHRSTGGVYLGLAGLHGESKQSQAARDVASGYNDAHCFVVSSDDFEQLPLASMAYWLSAEERQIYRVHPRLGTFAETRQGLATGDNNRFLREWWEVSFGRINRSAESRVQAVESGARWFPVHKGGSPRRWTGNDNLVIDWASDGRDLVGFRPRSVIRNPTYYFRAGATWSSLSGEFAVRFSPPGSIFESKGSMLFALQQRDLKWLVGYLNTPIARALIDSLSPTLDYHEGPVARIPVIVPADKQFVTSKVDEALSAARSIWLAFETSPGFAGQTAILGTKGKVQDLFDRSRDMVVASEEQILKLERDIENHFRSAAGLSEKAFPVAEQDPTGLVPKELLTGVGASGVLVRDLISLAVGSMFGRYSLDEPGLILAKPGDTLQEYLATVPEPSFMPDRDNVIPIVDGDWFEDDIVARFREFLRVSFGEEHFEANLRFVVESLGVKDLRDYFVKSFYKDHVQRYKKRPIYWLFSSPKGAFSALIYMHRYAPSTVSTVLNEYLREFKAKLETSRQHHVRLASGAGSPREKAAAEKEVDRLRKVLLELDEYEHDVLYPLATQQIAIDLDDGVLVNYQKFGIALKDIGLKKGGADE
jgi:hypothetical protein